MTDRVRWAERELRYRFSDPSLLEQALTHRSASRQNNERLEFLGDSLLNFAVARELYERRRDATEGDLSRARAALVRRTTLAQIGRAIGIDKQLILGGGESRSGGAQRSAALADAVEALIGAVLLDGGHAAAEHLVARLLAEHLERLPDAETLKDAKTRLQEWLQSRGRTLPTYSVAAVSGSDHQQVFTVVCEVSENATEGKGSSRRGAEQDAAARMLSELNDVNRE